MKRLCFVTAMMLSSSALAITLNVPGDFPTIRQGIFSSHDGDTVLVQPGTYYEIVDFEGRNIVLGSKFLTTGDARYLESTIIDGGWSGSVVNFVSAEDTSAVLCGFTITHGSNQFGGGIYCFNSSPTIRNNRILENRAYHGGGIYLDYASSPLIENNFIQHNEAGINYFMDGNGGAIYCGSASAPVIRNNVITHNRAGVQFNWYGYGGAIYCQGSTPFIVNNVIYLNQGYQGGGIYSIHSSMTVTNSIIWMNTALSSSDQLAGVGDVSYCDVQGGWTGTGNIDADPMFLSNQNKFNLEAISCGGHYDSPCIDAGDPNINDALLDCWHGLGSERSDMGAYGGGNTGWMAVSEPLNPGTSAPREYALSQNYPNPFNAVTVVNYAIPASGHVHIAVYDITGRLVGELLNGNVESGAHSISWDASGMSSGIYFLSMSASGFHQVRKMVLLK